LATFTLQTCDKSNIALCPHIVLCAVAVCIPTGKPEESANGWREDEQGLGKSDIDGCGDGE
jgi:hypothetical protein